MSTAIQWTDATWNPVVGCTPVSEGCRNCYAAKEAIRLGGNPNPKISELYAGTAEMRGLGAKRRAVFTGKVNLVPDRLNQPLRWRKPRRVFVNSMSDLFHESVPFEFIDRVFAVMWMCPQHTFQILTKRPERMQEWFSRVRRYQHHDESVLHIVGERGLVVGRREWPLPNVWLGTSVEDQAAAEERIPHLLRTPAAVRFLSCEPLLGPVDLSPYLGRFVSSGIEYGRGFNRTEVGRVEKLIDWVIVGGESGPGARPCNAEWIRSVVEQCKAVRVPVFVKQLGARPYIEGFRRDDESVGDVLTRLGLSQLHRPLMFEGRASLKAHITLRARKGDDPAEWPEDLRVREWPMCHN